MVRRYNVIEYEITIGSSADCGNLNMIPSDDLASTDSEELIKMIITLKRKNKGRYH